MERNSARFVKSGVDEGDLISCPSPGNHGNVGISSAVANGIKSEVDVSSGPVDGNVLYNPRVFFVNDLRSVAVLFEHALPSNARPANCYNSQKQRKCNLLHYLRLSFES